MACRHRSLRLRRWSQLPALRPAPVTHAGVTASALFHSTDTRRAALCLPWRVQGRVDALRGPARGPGECRAGDRGSPLLQPWWHRRPRPVARRLGQSARRHRTAGRQHADSAIRQADLFNSGTHAAAQDSGSRIGGLAGKPSRQEGDFPTLHQHGLFRGRSLRHRGSGPALFRQACRGSRLGRECDARWSHSRAVALGPDRRPRGGQGQGGCCALVHGRCRPSY